jgi:hypothetical protein
MLGFCVLCVLGSNEYSGVVPRIHPMPHSPALPCLYEICVLRSAQHRVGPVHFPICVRYLVFCFFANCTLAKCAAAVPDRLTNKLRLPHYIITVPCQGWSTDTCLHFSQDAFDDVVGKKPRLWTCPPAVATESHNQDTMDLLEPSLASPPGGPEEKYY